MQFSAEDHAQEGVFQIDCFGYQFLKASMPSKSCLLLLCSRRAARDANGRVEGEPFERLVRRAQRASNKSFEGTSRPRCRAQAPCRVGRAAPQLGH